MPISGSETSNQSGELFSDFVQSFQPSFVMFHFELVMRATRPINTIVLPNLGDFPSKCHETFDDIWFVHSHGFTISWQSKSKDARSGSTKAGAKAKRGNNAPDIDETARRTAARVLGPRLSNY
jgi:hypothetical protein